MTNDKVNETTLSSDSYDSIVFRGSSAQYLAQVIDKVTGLARCGDIYPPAFAHRGQPEMEYGLSLQPHGPEDKKLTPAEAVAMLVLAEEGSGIAQNMFHDLKTTTLISDIIGDPNGWLYDVVEGMTDFGYRLLAAVKIRQRIVSGEAAPIGRTNRDIYERDLWQRFKSALELDGLVVRDNTVNAAVNMAEELVKTVVRDIPESAKKEKELQARMNSRRCGIRLGAKIYQQVLNIAIQRGLPTKLEQTIETELVTPRQISRGTPKT